MRAESLAEVLASAGVPPHDASGIVARVEEVLRAHPSEKGPDEQVRAWADLQALIRSTPALAARPEAQAALYRRAYEGRPREAGPGPAWLPSPEDAARTNLGRLMAARGLARYEDFHRWSIERRDAFWETAIRTLAVYLDEQGSIIKTAQKLHLHRNAVANRLRNITELLDIDLDDPDQRLVLQLACRARLLS